MIKLEAVGNDILVVVQEATGGFSFVLPEHWTIAAIENHFKELQELYG